MYYNQTGWLYETTTTHHEQQQSYHHHEDFSAQDNFIDWEHLNTSYDFNDNHLVASSSDSLDTGNANSPSSYNPSEFPPHPIPDCSSRKRRHDSESSEPGLPINPAKARRLKEPESTALVRRTGGACYYCTKRKKPCKISHDPDEPCESCLKKAQEIVINIPGLQRPSCWKPKITGAEIFRKGPTVDFAHTTRGHHKEAQAGSQAVWKGFVVRGKGRNSGTVVQLSQNWTGKTLSIPLEKYAPRPEEKQYYSWHHEDVERRYETKPYGIADRKNASFAIERFIEENATGYVKAHTRSGSKITQKALGMALEHKHLHLVNRTLKLWVACRFIEEPWSIVGSETLGMSKDMDPNSPYHNRIPVPPIVDQQIDLLVIDDTLRPLLKEILDTLHKLLYSNAPWKDFFEIYLAYFILMHNVELTMAHDAWFVKRHNLKTKYSNKPLIDTITQGATLLLACFHYAHQGYAPFTHPEIVENANLTDDQKQYIHDIRSLFGRTPYDYVQDRGKELYWTSQLHKSDWRPIAI